MVRGFLRPACAVALATAATVAVADSRAPKGPIEVGPNVQVSKALPGDPHFEMQIAADPEHAERLMACSMVFPTSYHTSEVVTYVSEDGGRSWTPTLRTRGEAGYESWDPTCAYGPGGIAYTFSENIDAEGHSFDRVDRSADAGRTWEGTTRTKHAERNFLTIDNTGGARNGWLYLQGSGSTCPAGQECANGRAYYFQYSADQGRTFQSQLVPVAEDRYNIGFGPGAILKDGTYVAPMGEWKNYYRAGGRTGPLESVLGHDGRWANSALRVFRAKSDKPNWPLAIDTSVVSDWFLERRMDGSFLPMLAADGSNGPFRDRLYMVWPDVGYGPERILLSHSDDQGKTWSRPRMIDDPPRTANGEGPDDLHGLVAVNRDGIVGVSWYDRRVHRDDLGWDVRFRASFDGGETFTPGVKVSEVPYLPDRTDPLPLNVQGQYRPGRDEAAVLGVHNFNFSGGHTAGLAASADGSFHPLWVGNPAGVPQLWTAAVKVSGTVVKNGSAALAKLEDAGAKVMLRYTNRRLSRASRVAEFDLQVENVSKDTLRTPLFVRILDVGSELGAPEFMESDQGGTGEGAVFDFTPLTDGEALAPGATTRARHVRIKMTELDPLRPRAWRATASLATFSTRVLAGKVVPGKKEDTAGETR